MLVRRLLQLLLLLFIIWRYLLIFQPQVSSSRACTVGSAFLHISRIPAFLGQFDIDKVIHLKWNESYFQLMSNMSICRASRRQLCGQTYIHHHEWYNLCSANLCHRLLIQSVCVPDSLTVAQPLRYIQHVPVHSSLMQQLAVGRRAWRRREVHYHKYGICCCADRVLAVDCDTSHWSHGRAEVQSSDCPAVLAAQSLETVYCSRTAATKRCRWIFSSCRGIVTYSRHSHNQSEWRAYVIVVIGTTRRDFRRFRIEQLH